ncbi:MAG: response regulator [Polyangiales bacterium]
MKKHRPRPFTLPRAEPSKEPRKLVLYVEDDEANREVASARLAKGYQVVLAVDDREACKAVLEHGAQLSLILMDIELQGSALNGIDLTRLFRGKPSAVIAPSYAVGMTPIDTPILFVTAYGERYDRSELLAAGGDEIIQKPVDFVALHTAMARAYLGRLHS